VYGVFGALELRLRNPVLFVAIEEPGSGEFGIGEAEVNECLA
jgi:hypothetical protein